MKIGTVHRPTRRLHVIGIGIALVALVSGSSLLVAESAKAQSTWPVKPIRLVVPFAPGGGVDVIARLVGQRLSERLGQPFVIDNRAGASTIIGTDAVARSAPDGYTLLMASTSLTANQSLFRKLPFDLQRDLIPVSMVANSPAVLVVNEAVPARTLQEFLKLAAAKPGALAYASYGNGSSPHLVTELFEQMTNTTFLHVPYKGGGPAVMATISGETSLVIPSVVPVLNQVREGKLRALAVAADARLALLPDVPTFKEQGVPLTTGTWFGMLAPTGTPDEIVQRLNREIASIVNDPAMKRQLLAEGAVSESGPSKEFGRFMADEIERWKKVVTAAGIQPE